MKTLGIRAPVTIATLVSLIVLILALLVQARSMRHESESWDWVVHTRDVLHHVQTALTLASDAEAAQRGYLLTSNEAFSAVFHQARVAVPAQTRTLRELTRDNPAQQTSLAAFDGLLSERMRMLERVMQGKRAGQPLNPADLEAGRLLKERIVTLAARIRAEEQRLLDERERRADDARTQLILAVGSVAALSVGLIIVLWVISARGAAAMRARLAQIETIYRAVPVGLGYVDADLCLREMNEALASLSGHSKEQSLGRNPASLLPRPVGEQVGALLEQVRRERKPLRGVEFSSPDGASKTGRRDWLASYFPVVDARQEDQQVQGIVVALLEVSEIKAAQRALEEVNQTLERRIDERTAQIGEANAELRAFAHTVAHDLRAPLRNVEGFATALLEDEADRMSEDGKLFAERIVAAVVRMDRLITDLLAYSRLARAEMGQDRVDMQSVLRSVLRDVESAIAASGAAVTVEPDLPSVLGNQSVLVQIFDNLLSNAIKFVAPGVTPRVRVTGAQDGAMARFAIEDNGIGIAPEHHQHVFGVFERLHGHEQYPGTGIGLAIVKKGVERMGGNVHILARPDGGTTFELTLRAADCGAADIKDSHGKRSD